MADTRDDAAEKADYKAGRRASFAHAFRVPNIARRVKQFEQAVQSEQTHTAKPSRPKAAELRSPEKPLSPKLSAPSVATRETSLEDDDTGGAEIPNILLRRSSNTINADFTESSLDAWERFLAAGGMQDGEPSGAPNFNSLQLRAEKRYDAQYTAIDDMALYPVTERSCESSLPSLSEASPEPSLRRRTPSPPPSPKAGDRPLFPPRRDTAQSVERSVELPTSPIILRPASPFDREKAPSRLAESRSTSVLTATSNQSDDQPSAALPALQAIGIDDPDGLHPVSGDDVDPESFDLLIPASNTVVYSLEHRSELLFSVEHMRIIILDPILLHRFSTFLAAYRPQRVPLLNYLLEALKALRALEYVNGIISRSLRPDRHQLKLHPAEFAAKSLPELTVNESLKQKTAAAFEALAQEDLPAYITHVWMEIVELSMRQKTMGLMPQNLQYKSEGLAEVFCITDPSRKDNPIVFASEEFHRTTQYGPDYVMGRNCRFLQGPRTNPFSIQRIRDKLAQGKEHHETFLNYRRDGLPFMNLLMCTPLLDSMGHVRYYLGAQIDVSGLAKDCSGLESLRKLVDQDEQERRQSQQDSQAASDAATRRDSGADLDEPFLTAVGTATTTSSAKDPTRSPDRNNDFRLLAEMLSRTELETVRRFGGRMHRSQQEQGQHLEAIGAWHKPRVVLHDQYSPPSSPPQGLGPRRGYDVSDANGNINISVTTPPKSDAQPSPTMTSPRAVGRLPAIFENYLVVRPYPSLRILFASPTLRMPGILQSHFMSRIGGSQRIHEQLEQAFAEGHCVTATVKWISGGRKHAAAAAAATTTPDSASGASSGSTGSTAATVVAANGHEAAIGQEGRKRWIHCTPLLGANGHVGVWIVVIVDDDGEVAESRRRRRETARYTAPPVAPPTSRAVGGQVSPRGFDEMSPGDYAAIDRVSDDGHMRKTASSVYEETRRREAVRTPSVASGEREWDKGLHETGADKTEESSQRSETRAKSPSNGGLVLGLGKPVVPVAGGALAKTQSTTDAAATAAAHPVSGDTTPTSAGNGTGTLPYRNTKKAAKPMSPFERARGSFGTVRNNLLAAKLAAEAQLQEERSKSQNQDPQQKAGANEPVSVTAARKSSYLD